MSDDQFDNPKDDWLDMYIGEGKLTEEEAAEIRNPPFKKCIWCGATEKRFCECWED